jgi:hypothetical protein
MVSPFTQLGKPVAVMLKEKVWGTHYRIKAYPVDGRDEFAYISDLTIRGKEALRKRGVRFANVAPSLAVKD